MTGSTNFSVTGLYVNSNHILIFNDPKVAAKYADLFETVWTGDVKLKAYLASPLSSETFSVSTPKAEITFAPHDETFAGQVLGAVVDRIKEEGKKPGRTAAFYSRSWPSIKA